MSLEVRKTMKTKLSVILTLNFTLIAIAHSEDTATKTKTYHYIESNKNSNWPDEATIKNENLTRIGSAVTKKYFQNDETGEVTIKESKTLVPDSPVSCQDFDVDSKYSNYFYIQQTEEMTSDRAPLSNWISGEKFPGKVIKQEVVYCYAN